MSFKSTIWKDRVYQWKRAREKLVYGTGSQEEIFDESDFCSTDEFDLQQLEMDDESREPLSRKVHISASKIYPNRVTIIIRLIICVLFLLSRLTHPIHSAHGPWVISVLCEVWFCISWFLDQLLKWKPVTRETYLDRLCLRYNQPGKPSELDSIDVFIYIDDSQKREPLVTANTVLSVLFVNYPARQYEEFKIHINVLATEFKVKPSEGWTMKDGTPWPGNDNTNHPGMLQILMGSGEPHGSDSETRPGFQHNNMAGALNALVRLSALLSNGAYILNLDCDQYINNSKTFLESMCFMMDPSNKKICYVQFPQRFDGIDANDRYATHNTILYDVNLKCLDGIQGPLYVGTCCFFFRKSLYGSDPSFESERFNTSWRNSRKRSSSDSLGLYAHVIDESNSIVHAEKLYGQSPLLIANLAKDDRLSLSASPDEILREAIHVISLDYEDNTAWGRELTKEACIWTMLILILVLANAAFKVSLQEWWRDQQFWVIAGVSSHFFAVLKGLGRVLLSLRTCTIVNNTNVQQGQQNGVL